MLQYYRISWSIYVLQHKPGGLEPGEPAEPEEPVTERQLPLGKPQDHLCPGHRPNGGDGPFCELPERQHSCLLRPVHIPQEGAPGCQ